MTACSNRTICRALLSLLVLGAAAWAVPAGAEDILIQPGESIQAALDQAAPGDRVILAAGVHHQQDLLLPAGVTLRGATGDPQDVTIATEGSAPALAVARGAGAETAVEFITFTRGPGNPGKVLWRGGGILCLGASPAVTWCRFENLTAAYGAAVFCGDGAEPEFTFCVFRHNRAEAVGGALAAVGASQPRLVDCLVADNEAAHAGGAFNLARGVQLLLVDCTVAGNGAAAPALSCWAGARAVTSGSIISDPGLWIGDDSGLILAQCSDIYSTGGAVTLDPGSSQTISLDPLFCSDLAGDHHYDLAEASPCTPEASPGCGGMGSRPVGCGVSAVDDPPSSDAALPKVTRLREGYPNPFNPSTTIGYDLARDGQVSLAVYNLAGRLINQLVHESQAAGRHDAVWRGRDARGRTVAAGVYVVRLKTADTVDTHRVTLVK